MRAIEMRPRTAATLVALVCTLPALLGSECAGSGRGGQKPVENRNVDPECSALFGQFPPGLALLPGERHGIVATASPQTVVPFELGASPPRNVGPADVPPFPADSDGDGEEDAFHSFGLGFGLRTPILGRLATVSESLVLASASSYEQVMPYDPFTAALRTLSVTNPAESGLHDPADHPFLPAAGTTADRTAVATRVCVRPPAGVDSGGVAIERECDPAVPSYHTGFTAGAVVSNGLLAVTTSNLANAAEGRFRPGSVLLFAWNDAAAPIAVQPLVEQPVVFTTHFNPTSITPWRTAAGRDVLLVGQTGAIRLASGPDSVLSDAAIDVFDVASRRIAATIPLGRAGLDFGGPSIDEASGLGVIGAATQKQIYAFDLAPLDDERLYAGTGAPIALDGSDPLHPDARVYTGEAPFEIPARAGGPDPETCDGWTSTLIGPDRDGDPERRDVYVTDRCDGTLTLLDVDLRGATETPLDPSRFRVVRQLAIESANVPANVGLPKEPNAMVLAPNGRVPGAPGPHLYYVRNLETAAFCALDLSF